MKTKGAVRGQLYSAVHTHKGRKLLVWHASVTVGEHIVWADNGTQREHLLTALEGTVYAFRRLQELGQKKFLTWATVVDRAQL